MQPTDKRKFLEIINGMAALKPGKPLTPQALDLFWNAMRAWTIAEFEAAANHLMQTVEFMPNPFHFEQLRRASEPTAAEAWLEAGTRAANRRFKQYPNDRISRAVACIGGLDRIAMSDIERDLPHIQRRFMEAYAELTDVEQVREALPQIAKLPAQFESALESPRKAVGFQKL